jgi:dUTP pyrophosphatase
MQIQELVNEIKAVRIKVIAEKEDLLPVYASKGAAGADVKANIPEDIIIPAGTAKLIPTGLKFEIPEGYEIQVRPRSGLALKNGITVLNTPGTIDSDYRGEVGVILINPNMRIAQIVVAEVTIGQFFVADSLAASERGDGGFGHTGVR